MAHTVKEVLSKARKGKDLGKHNNGKTTGFKAVEKKAAGKYHSEEAGERVAGSIFQKMKRAGKL